MNNTADCIEQRHPNTDICTDAYLGTGMRNTLTQLLIDSRERDPDAIFSDINQTNIDELLTEPINYQLMYIIRVSGLSGIFNTTLRTIITKLHHGTGIPYIGLGSNLRGYGRAETHRSQQQSSFYIWEHFEDRNIGAHYHFYQLPPGSRRPCWHYKWGRDPPDRTSEMQDKEKYAGIPHGNIIRIIFYILYYIVILCIHLL